MSDFRIKRNYDNLNGSMEVQLYSGYNQLKNSFKTRFKNNRKIYLLKFNFQLIYKIFSIDYTCLKLLLLKLKA